MIASAGRSRLIELHRERAIGRDGRALLDRKREAIVRAVSERVPRLEALRASVATALGRARDEIVRAQLEAGRATIDAAALAQPRTLNVSAADARCVGVFMPVVQVDGVTFVPRYGPAGAPPCIDRAGAAFAALLPDLVALASQDAAVRRLRRALNRTVRRLNALDSIVLPELSREICRATSALDEEERDDAVRRERHRKSPAERLPDSASD